MFNCKGLFIFLYIIIYLLYKILIFTFFNTPNSVHISEVHVHIHVHVHKNQSKCTMTYKVYFHAPKCTFNPDPIWDQKWNYMDPCQYLNGFNKNKTQHQTLLSTKTNQGRIYFIRPKNMSQISDIAAVNHVTQAVIRVGSKIES